MLARGRGKKKNLLLESLCELVSVRGAAVAEDVDTVAADVHVSV